VAIRWGKNLWWKAMEWYARLLFLPLIFRVCRRLDFTASRWRTIACQLAGGVIFSLLHCAIVTFAAWIQTQLTQAGPSLVKLCEIVLSDYFYDDVLTYAGIVSVWYALDYYRQFQERERHAAQLEKHLARARLQALKMQLHPHFLFNTLNGIASLTHENPKAANRMLARLSDLLRLTLKDDGIQEVSLRRELDFNRCYLELEQIRLGDRLTMKWEIAPETLDATVPNLLLQPLVENAIRHGIAPYAARGEISIHAQRVNGSLHLSVSDSGPGLLDGKRAPNAKGLGLANTSERLQQLYGDAQRLEIRNGERGGCVVRIVIPFRAAETEVAPFEVEYEDSNSHC
jgi:two-component sensor histidine kinase